MKSYFRLFLTILSVFSIVFLAGMIFYDISIYEKNVVEKHILVNELDAHRITKTIQDRVMELVLLGSFPEEEDYVTHMNSFDSTQNTFMLDPLISIDASGKVTEVSSSAYSFLVDVNVADKDFFFIPALTKAPYISKPTLQGNDLIIYISVPIFSSDNLDSGSTTFLGVLLTVVNLNDLFLLEKEFSGDYVVFDDTDNVILQYGNPILIHAITTHKNALLISNESLFSFENGYYLLVAHSNFFAGDHSYSLFYITSVSSSYRIIKFSILALYILLNGLFLYFIFSFKPFSQNSSEIKLAELDRNILEFILSHPHIHVTFGKISKEFSITKPTTRLKIKSLVKQGFLDIEESGRNKILHLSEKAIIYLKK